MVCQHEYFLIIMLYYIPIPINSTRPGVQRIMHKMNCLQIICKLHVIRLKLKKKRISHNYTPREKLQVYRVRKSGIPYLYSRIITYENLE